MHVLLAIAILLVKTDTEIICLPLPKFFELSNHVSECTQNAPFRGKKIQKFSDSPLTRPLPIGRGTPVFEYSRWQNCYWNDVHTETETQLKLKNFIETRTENNSDTV